MADEAPPSAAAQVVWLSLDPVRCKLDFYPRVIAERVEAAFAASEQQCVLGADFFNATVHFQDGSCFQTTPGQHFGRGGFKQPGYRTVKRVVKEGPTTTILGKRVHGEWRIAEREDEMERTFVGEIPDECLVAPGSSAAPAPSAIRVWKAEDLASAGADAGTPEPSLVIWQWCRGVPEENGNLMSLGDEMWSPFLEDNNAAVEQAFQLNAGHANIQLGQRRLSVFFTPGSTFALQRDTQRHKERAVRRVVKPPQALREMMSRLQVAHNYAADAALEQLQEGMANLSTGDVVSSFLCPITQDVMTDPVMTADGHTYERDAIEHWLESHNTSPLTGLPLSSHVLTPNAQLLAQIQAASASAR